MAQIFYKLRWEKVFHISIKTRAWICTIYIKKGLKPCVVAYTFNSNIQKVEVGRSL